jgi:5'-3' exonuclease
MYTVNTKDSDDMQNGMLIHMLINMIKKASEKFNPQHLVICTDGNKSWRKNIYYAYKANRIEKLQQRSPADALREERLKDVFKNDFLPFLKDSTNVSFLSCENAEADDLIARFVKTHTDDLKVILSTDNDYIQLLDENTIIYNSMEERIITKDCIFTADKHQPLKFAVKDGKVSISRTDFTLEKGEPLTPMKDWVEYALFMKCIRGDVSDNIISAFPRVRETSTKKQIGIRDAFEDRKDKGYNWQNFMNSTWTNPLGEKKIVKECYEFNRKLIDLNEIPDDLKQNIDNCINELKNKENKTGVVMNVSKYLKKWGLEKLLTELNLISSYFAKSFPKD